MATARDLITRAFTELQIYKPGEQLLDTDAAYGLLVANDMLDSWSNESLTCYAILEQSVQLIPGQYQYTVGPGGNVNGTRPLKLIKDPGGAYIQDNAGNTYDMEVVERDFWNLITLRGTPQGGDSINSNIPSVLFYDPQFPLGILNFYPTPNIGYTAYWDSYLQIADFSGISGAFSFPPGYKDAVQLNLSIALAPAYPRAVLSQATIKRAADAKRNIKVTNQREVVAVYDPELVSRARTTPLIDFYRGGG